MAHHDTKPVMEKSLSDATHRKITKLSQAGDKLAKAGEAVRAVAKYNKALGLLPEPREDWSAATWLHVAIGDARFLQMDFEAALENFQTAMRCPDAVGNPFIHLRHGQCLFETGNVKRAEDDLMRAYMGGGPKIFDEDDPKYFDHIKKLI